MISSRMVERWGCMDEFSGRRPPWLPNRVLPMPTLSLLLWTFSSDLIPWLSPPLPLAWPNRTHAGTRPRHRRRWPACGRPRTVAPWVGATAAPGRDTAARPRAPHGPPSASPASLPAVGIACRRSCMCRALLWFNSRTGDRGDKFQGAR
jgi:hypothetical protein